MKRIGLHRELAAGVGGQRLGRYLLVGWIALLAPPVLAANSHQAPPNIVFVVSDDRHVDCIENCRQSSSFPVRISIEGWGSIRKALWTG